MLKNKTGSQTNKQKGLQSPKCSFKHLTFKLLPEHNWVLQWDCKATLILQSGEAWERILENVLLIKSNL